MLIRQIGFFYEAVCFSTEKVERNISNDLCSGNDQRFLTAVFGEAASLPSLLHYRNLQVVKDLLSSPEALQELEAEWKQLEDDRRILRQTFPNGESRVVLPCNLHRIIWNAQKIFRVNMRVPTDLHPLKVGIKGLKGVAVTNLSLFTRQFSKGDKT